MVSRGVGKINGAATIGRILHAFRKSQWWDTPTLESFQTEKLNQLVKYATQTTPYYQDLFAQQKIDLANLTLERWSDLPILGRETLQKNRIQSSKVPVNHGRIGNTTSSGSTGEPVTIDTTELSQCFFHAFNIRKLLWHKSVFSGTHASIRLMPNLDVPAEGLFYKNWGMNINRFIKTGPSQLFCIRNSIGQQLEWLQKHKPDYLLTYPSNLRALLEESSSAGILFPTLKEVRTIGETVSDELRRLCRNLWGIKLVDSYSSQELGTIAIQCPSGDHYHVQSEGVFVEVLDENDQPCQPGEIGRVVITSLNNYATPLIRYEIRDFAEVGEPCDCGRKSPVLKRIVGRQRNMLIMPSGERFWPVFGMLGFRKVAPVKQTQFIQHSKEQLEMKYTSERPLTAGELSQLQEIIQQSLRYPFKIKFTALESIPQRENFKVEDFISLIA